ncbi:MAG: type III-A CRISPR-associated protein Cas10/Csm1 [Syntrophobacterales bacterium]|nr:type III-A CRISPR-associated protein Cas10/Csm1 [Syntrophobacterales bacterium]
MDESVLITAAAAMMHDLGKLTKEGGLEITKDYENNNAGLYQPFYSGRYTHDHALYTARFIEEAENLLPPQLKGRLGTSNQSFINLAARHHKPETPWEWIIAISDRISSGWDRANFDSEYNAAINWRDYRKTRLLSAFEYLLRDDEKYLSNYDSYKYCYPLRELSPTAIFPILKKEGVPAKDAEAKDEYKRLYDNFFNDLKGLRHREDNLALWLDHFDSLMLIYTANIPAARAGTVIPDVSLYDHARATAAIAAALYSYHREHNTLTEEAVRNESSSVFLLIGGDFYGIQNYIFCDSGETRQNRAKILRGRSFAVSLLCELAADLICRSVGLPSTSVLLNAAGKFTIIAPNTEQASQAVATAEDKINNWLIEISAGESALGISSVTAAPADFVAGKFINVYDCLNAAMAERKFHKFDLHRYGGTVKGFLNKFNNDLTPPICPYCGKRPSSPAAENFKSDRDDKSLCTVCRDHIFLGENIVKKNRIAITAADAELANESSRLLEPIFGIYQAAFIEGGLSSLARSGKLFKCWDISLDPTGKTSRDVTARFLNGYVPVYRDEDLYDERILEGAKADTKKEEMIADIKEGRPKTFEHIAAMSLNPHGDKEGSYKGIQALGILKADVDHLGMIMSCGMADKQFTLSRIAAVSRQLNFFFAVYLPQLLATDPVYHDVYTVFAGGDDLFLIGPWNRIISLAAFLKDRFAEYVCQNEHIHFSAGISIRKPHIPLDKLANGVEEALHAAKNGNPDKGDRGNCVNIFGETATWKEFEELCKVRDKLNAWREGGIVNNAMLFRLNRFLAMAAQEKELVKERDIPLADMECLKWRAYLRYTTERNVGKNGKDEETKAKMKQEFGLAAKWLNDYAGKLRIALWDVIYNNR